jgi:hypothetical protein
MPAGSTESSLRGSLLYGALAVLSLYVAWQAIPLRGRVDTLERDRMEANDRLLARIEALETRVARLKSGDAAASSGRAAAAPSRPAPARGSVDSAAAAPPADGTRAARASVMAEEFLSRRLLPGDASLALSMVQGVPLQRLAERSRHSPGFVIGKAVQIEKQLAAAPDTPPEIVAAIRSWLERARAIQR